jgi:hypothetical protein
MMMFRFLAKFFGLYRPSTVDEAIRALLEAQTDLATVAEDRRAAATRGRALISNIQDQVDSDVAEADRAKVILDKLLALTSTEGV